MSNSRTKKNHKSKKSQTRKRIGFYKKPPSLLNINGYYLLLLPLPLSNAIRIDCNIFGGGLLENSYDSGIAHLLEHIIMSAWQRCGTMKCSLYLEKYGISSNASTSSMYTKYWAKALPKFESVILDYIFEIIFHPRITPNLLTDEKKIVREELEGYINNPKWKLSNLIVQNFYKSKGLQNVADYKKQITALDNINIKMLYDYMDRSRVENCLMFTVSGKFKRDNIIKYFKQKTSSLPRNEFNCRMLHFNRLKSCFTFRKKVIFVRNNKAENTQISINFPSNILPNDKDSKLLPFLNKIIASDLTSLIVKRLRLELNLVYGASIYSIENLCGTSFVISISTSDSNVVEVLKETFGILKKYSKELIPVNTLLHEKRQFTLSMNQLSYKNPDLVASLYIPQYFWQLNNIRNIYTFGHLRREIRDISRQKIRRLIRNIFNTNHCIVGYIGKRRVNFTINDF